MNRAPSPRLLVLTAMASGCLAEIPLADDDSGSSGTSTASTGIPPADSSSTVTSDSTGVAPGSDSTGDELPPCMGVASLGGVCWRATELDGPGGQFALVDHDGDGVLDLVVGEDGCGPCDDGPMAKLWRHRGSPAGTFAAPDALVVLDDYTYGWNHVIAMGPGHDGANRVFTLRDVEAGFLSVPQSGILVGEEFVDPTEGIGPGELTLGEPAVLDLDGDGVLDLLWLDSAIRSFISEPGGGFTAGLVDLGDALLNGAPRSDRDGDGDLDLLALRRDDGYIDGVWHGNVSGAWLLADGAGGFGTIAPSDSWPFVALDLRGDTAELADLDGDGDLDVLGAFRQYLPGSMSSVVDRMVVVPGGADGFETQLELQLDGEFSAFELVDLNGDAYVDLALTTVEHGDALQLFAGTPSLAFEPLGELPLTPGIATLLYPRIEATDLDADGRVDFVFTAASDDGARIVVLLSDPA